MQAEPRRYEATACAKGSVAVGRGHVDYGGDSLNRRLSYVMAMLTTDDAHKEPQEHREEAWSRGVEETFVGVRAQPRRRAGRQLSRRTRNTDGRLATQLKVVVSHSR